MGWLSFFAIYAGTVAALAVILGESLARACGFGETGKLAFAASIILACSALNVRSVRVAALANNLTSAMKIAAIFAFVALGLLLGEGSFPPGWHSARGSI